MSKYQALIDALESGPTDGDWEAWGNGNSRYGVTGPSAAAAGAASNAVRDCHITCGQPPVYVASSKKQVAALAFGDTKAEAQINADYIAAANPATIRALLADLERTEKDAARYRELKKRFRAMSLNMGGNHTWVLASSGWLKGPSMDEAVDALAQMAGG